MSKLNGPLIRLQLAPLRLSYVFTGVLAVIAALQHVWWWQSGGEMPEQGVQEGLK